MPGRRWLSVVTTVLLLTAVMIPPAVRAEAPPTAPVSTPTAPVPQQSASVPGASSGNVRPSEATPSFIGSRTDQRDAWGGGTTIQVTPTASPKVPQGEPQIATVRNAIPDVTSSDANALNDAPPISTDTGNGGPKSVVSTTPPMSLNPANGPDGSSLRPAASATFDALANPADHKNSSGNTSPTKLIVAFKSGGVRTNAASNLHSLASATVIDTIPQLSVDVVEFADAIKASNAITVYSASSAVTFAEYDQLNTISETPNDPQVPSQYALSMVSAPSAWDITHGSSMVKIAVLDTGVFTGHPDLQGKIVASKNFTGTLATDVADRNGHGTHTAGIASASTNNGAGVAGLGYNSSLVIGKVLGDDGSGNTSWVASGIVWATDQGAKVISMSLGSDATCSQTYQTAIDYAWARGVVIVAAAGNDTALGAIQPGNCTHVVSVASTNSADQLSYFSNFGPYVTVAAPGSAILSTTFDGGYGYMSGTSMATPLVAGLVGLVWATGWGTSNQSVVDRLTSSADQISGTGSAFKYGRVNAYRAVGGNPPQPPVSSVPNDFSNYAKYIPSLPYSDNESTVGATFGTSEIYCTANPYGASVWYQWTPTTSEWVTANTGGSTFDTFLAVWTYNGAWVHSACNDEGYSSGHASRAEFYAWAGQQYWIQVAGYQGATGQLAFRIGQDWSNDYFDTPQVVAWLPLSQYFDTTVGSLATGEPRPCANIAPTYWYRYTASSSSKVRISTAGSNFDTALAVYWSPSGSTTQFSSLTSLGCFDNSGNSLQAEVILTPVAGQTYYIQIGGSNWNTGSLNVQMDVIVPPANDNLSSSWPITTNSSDWVVSTSGASVETGETSYCASFGNTVWYRWTPQTTGIATVTTYGSDFDTVLSIYSGPSSGPTYSSLLFLDCNDDVSGAGNRWSSVSGGVLAGSTYYIQLGGYYPAFGSSHITTSVIAVPTPTATASSTATPSSTATASRTPTSTATSTPSASRTLSLQAGWNLVALGISPQPPVTATTLCASLNTTGGSGTAVEIDRWQSGGWDPHVCALTANDFPIDAARGYFVRTTRAVSYAYAGNAYSPSPSMTLGTGWNLVGLPTTAGTAASLLSTIDANAGVTGTAVEVDRWQSGGWEAHVRGLPVNAFSIEAGRGYFVRLTRPAGPLPASVSNPSVPDLNPSQTATATATPTSTSSSTPTASPTPTLIPSASATPPLNPSPSPSPTPTATPTTSPTATSVSGAIGPIGMHGHGVPPDPEAPSTPPNAVSTDP